MVSTNPSSVGQRPYDGSSRRGTKTFDPKCYDLASAFLEDEPHLFDDDRATRLARIIQGAVEDFIASENDSYEPPDTSIWRDAETPFAENH